MIPTLEAWTEREHGEINYHLTQALSGHGCYNDYLHRFAKRGDSHCDHCPALIDNAEHTLFECNGWHNRRQVGLRGHDGEPLTPDTLVKAMLRSRKDWNRIAGAIEDIMREKEEMERKRQQEERAAAATHSDTEPGSEEGQEEARGQKQEQQEQEEQEEEEEEGVELDDEAVNRPPRGTARQNGHNGTTGTEPPGGRCQNRP